jgi:ribosomal protein S18 acetylase RimI-like enzyme
MKTDLQIRNATIDDLSSVSTIASSILERRFEGLEFWIGVTRRRPELSWVAETEGHVRGWALAWPDLRGTAAKLRFNLMVDPGSQGLGLGRALLRELEHAAVVGGASQMRISADLNETNAIKFLVADGFEEHHRMIFSRLFMNQVQFARLDAALSESQGFVLRDYPVAEQGESSFWEQLSELHNAVMASMAPYYDDLPIVSTPQGFQSFVKNEQYPGMDGRIFVIGDRSVLLGYATAYREGNHLHHGLTGVHPDFRGRRVGLALKRAVLRYASEFGCESVETGNRSNNPEILELNRSLGFREERVELRLWKSWH